MYVAIRAVEDKHIETMKTSQITAPERPERSGTFSQGQQATRVTSLRLGRTAYLTACAAVKTCWWLRPVASTKKSVKLHSRGRTSRTATSSQRASLSSPATCRAPSFLNNRWLDAPTHGATALITASPACAREQCKALTFSGRCMPMRTAPASIARYCC